MRMSTMKNFTDFLIFFFCRVEQQKNSLLLEKNEMLAAVEDVSIEKVQI